MLSNLAKLEEETWTEGSFNSNKVHIKLKSAEFMRTDYPTAAYAAI